MSNHVSTDLRPPETRVASGAEPVPPASPRISGRRLALAFVLAGLADVFSVVLTWTPPVQWAADVVTAILLFVVLGWQWILLPGLIMEAVPGLDVLPFWVLVVGAVAVWVDRAAEDEGGRS